MYVTGFQASAVLAVDVHKGCCRQGGRKVQGRSLSCSLRTTQQDCYHKSQEH